MEQFEEEKALTQKGEHIMAVGDMVDKYFRLNAERLNLDAQSKEIKSECDEIKEKIIAEMNAQGVEALGSQSGTVTLNKGVAHPSIKDKDAFVAFLKATDDFSMATIQINKAAYKEYFDRTGLYPDGTDVYYEDSLNTRKKK